MFFKSKLIFLRVSKFQGKRPSRSDRPFYARRGALTLALAALLPLVTLAGCGQPPPKNQTASKSSQESTPPATNSSPAPAPSETKPVDEAAAAKQRAEEEARVAVQDLPRQLTERQAGKIVQKDSGKSEAAAAQQRAVEEARVAAEGAKRDADAQEAKKRAELESDKWDRTRGSSTGGNQPSTADPQTPSDAEQARSLHMHKAKPPSDKPAEAQPEPAPSPAPPPPPRATEAQPPAAPGGSADDRKAAVKTAEAEVKYDVVPVFYGTDRAIEPDPKRLAFGAERGHKLQLGRALVTVPLSHKVPAVERPWVVEIPYFKVKVYEESEDNTKHFTLQEITALTKEQMLALVKERLAASKNFKDHAFVFVHGFNTSFDYALYRTAQIAYDMKFDGAPFVYSWPSGGKVASYTYDRGSTEQAEPHFTEFLNMVVKESGAKSISLIAHSMGSDLLMRVLERWRQESPDAIAISQVILAAPDVDRDKFDNIAREITRFARGVTLYAASNDRALGYSARFWGGVPRAGDVPASGPLIIPGVDTIDVTAVSTDSLGLNHSGYAENNALLNDIKLLLQTGERPPDKRIPILETIKTTAGGSYWRYPAVH